LDWNGELGTKPPVDLYCYYLFLQRESSEDVLDFWLDVQQHENLCRAYFKDIRKQGREIRDDWPRYYSHAREYGSIYSRTTGIVQREEWEDESDENDEAGVDDLLAGGIEKEWRGGLQSGHAEKLDDDDDEEMSDQQHPQATTSEDNQFLSTSKNNNPHDRSMMRTPSPSSNGPSPVYPLSPTLRAIYPHDANELGVNDRPASRRPRASTTQPYIPRSAAINRTDLIASAERIYTRYLLPGATKEIYLPVSIRINSFPLSSSTLPSVHHPSYEIESTAQARVPDMFSRQKDYVYEQMARESFPRFIRTKVWGNLTRTSGLIRLSAGLFALWVGLSTAFAFIFLDVVPRSTRLWVSPFPLISILSS
jgi:hypothetical protein